MVSFAAIAVVTPARAQSKVECVEAFTKAQQAVRNGLQLRSAQELYSTCVSEACPAPVRADCAAGLEQIARDMPTVVLGARTAAGHDLPDTRISVDGVAVAMEARVGGVPLDPGRHVFRFEHGEYPPIEEELLLNVGEKNRAVVVTFGPKDGERPPDAPANPAPDRDAGRRTAGYVVGTAGLVALAVGTGLGIAVAVRCGGLLREPCKAVDAAPFEEQKSTRDSIVTQSWIANVAFAVGIAGVGTAAVLLLWPSKDGRGAVVRAAPRAHAGGGGFELSGSF